MLDQLLVCIATHLIKVGALILLLVPFVSLCSLHANNGASRKGGSTTKLRVAVKKRWVSLFPRIQMVLLQNSQTTRRVDAMQATEALNCYAIAALNAELVGEEVKENDALVAALSE